MSTTLSDVDPVLIIVTCTVYRPNLSALRHAYKTLDQVFLLDGQFMANSDGITILMTFQLASIVILLEVDSDGTDKASVIELACIS